MANVGTQHVVEKPPPAPAAKGSGTETPDQEQRVERWHRPRDFMRRLLARSPFDAIAPVRLWREARLMEAPDFDVKESDDAFTFKADVPGIDAKHLDVRLAQNRLTVDGYRAEEKEHRGETYYVSERASGSFSRSFILPEATDNERVDADLTDGVLTITVPKLPAARAKQIKINTP